MNLGLSVDPALVEQVTLVTPETVVIPENVQVSVSKNAFLQ